MSHLNKLKISDKLAIKGGTAINYIYFNLPRLSEDIDLDYVCSHDKEQMQKDRKIIDKNLLALFKKHGYKTEKKDSWIIAKYFLHYTGINNNKDVIKLDLNYFKRISVLPLSKKKIKHFFDIHPFEVNTYQIEELLAEKISAMISRSTPRDIYDIYNLEHVKYNPTLLRKLIVFYVSMHSDLRKLNLNAIENVDAKEFTNQLAPQLIKRNTIKISEIKEFVLKKTKTLMNFNNTEIEFIKKLYDEKEYKPELLFNNPQLKEHPAYKKLLHEINQLANTK